MIPIINICIFLFSFIGGHSFVYRFKTTKALAESIDPPEAHFEHLFHTDSAAAVTAEC